MKKIIFIIISVFLISFFTSFKVIAQNDENKFSSSSIYVEQIEKILKNKYHNASNIIIKEIFIDTLKTFENETSFREGEVFLINQNCYIICFSTVTYNLDQSVKYEDRFKFYLPLNQIEINDKKIFFIGNSFHGKGYHGGSLLQVQISNWINEIYEILKSN
jgi:hypothetical protein